jgi:cell division protein FtsB
MEEEMSSHADILSEVDAGLLAQWRRKGLDHAADVVAAYRAENQRLREENAELKVEAEALHRLLRGSREALVGAAE